MHQPSAALGVKAVPFPLLSSGVITLWAVLLQIFESRREEICVLEKASHLPSGSRHWCQPGWCAVQPQCDVSMALQKDQDPTSFRSLSGNNFIFISRESAFHRATGLLELPWVGWAPWELSCITSNLSCYTPRSGFSSLLMRKIREICTDTNSHAYVHIAPSTFPKSIIHFLCFYLLCLIGKCLAVTMRTLG